MRYSMDLPPPFHWAEDDDDAQYRDEMKPPHGLMTVINYRATGYRTETTSIRV